jgi:dTDP-glucose pyrophosphorylase
VKNVQLLIPMAGLGSRFVSKGYSVPKPLLPIGRFRMIQVVLDNLLSSHVECVTLIISRQIADSCNFEELLKDYDLLFEIIQIDEITQGPASTCSLSRNNLNMDLPLVIANSDQFLDIDIKHEYTKWFESDADGVIWAMEDSSNKWSYVKTDLNGHATEVREKEVISNLATCGVYAFSKANDFFDSYDEMVSKDDRTNGEFYVAPTYNYLIDKGKKILVRNLGATSNIMHGLGVPDDYEKFISSTVSDRFR